MQPLIDYIQNKSDINSFELAVYHENQNNLSGAINYYLEAADITSNPLLEYESLLRAALCFDAQEGRLGTVIDLLYICISVLPERPEAIYHLARILNYKGRYYEAYATLESYLTRYVLSLNSLKKDCDYEGNHALVYEKGIAAWGLGKLEESRHIAYNTLINNYSPRYNKLSTNRLVYIGYPTLYKHSEDKVLKNPFPGSKTINYSQAMQDMFVLTILKGKEHGTYLEIGAGDPILNSNTYLLETKYNWSGVSVDTNFYKFSRFGTERKNRYIYSDALTLDYMLVGSVDYLQIDVDSTEVGYKILEKILNQGVKSKVITFEHDTYVNGDAWKNKSRELLTKDYVLTVADVCIVPGKSFEDWWVHKSIFSPEMLGESYKTPDKYFY